MSPLVEPNLCRPTSVDPKPNRSVFHTLFSICLSSVAFALVLGFGGGLNAADTPGSDSQQLGPADLVRVLFLGDDGMHQTRDRFRGIQPVLAEKQIEIVYTESLDDLNPARLAGFDVVLLYANHPEIAAPQEQALIAFIERGGGLVGVHAASACFQNSDRFAALLGARFSSHETGLIREQFTRPEHPILQGLSPIESQDDTYVHSHPNADRTILAERLENGRREPWTWVRDQGQGRVFYTAWGHGENTWENPGFQRLIERSIRWCAANSPTRLQPRTDAPPLVYGPAADALPNYTANAQWGTLGEPIQVMQQPLSPKDSHRHVATLPGFRTELFAGEPDIVNPIWISWDERGRLWVAETVDYPNELQPEGQGRDRLKICEDTTGDGRADKFTVFADGLSVPTGFVFANGGVIVIHSGRTEFFQDTTGDDRADVRRILFEGWSLSDTHATASNLRYGFDNWIWGVVGYSGFRGEVGGREVRFGQGIFRFKPDGSELEFLRSSNNNTWGLGLSEDGRIFGSTANGNASMYLPIPNRYYERVEGWSASRLETIADSQRFYPLTDEVRQVDYHGRYTAGAGSALYTAREFPREYWNTVQFVAEPTGHLLGKFHLRSHGADYTAHNGRSFMASTDAWFSPVAAEVGPDGALWIADWYNYIIQHNPTPRGFQTGRGNAYETPLRDRQHGRIYRVVWDSETTDASTTSPATATTTATSKSSAAPPSLRLDQMSPREWVRQLRNNNMLWRQHAQRLLVERNQRDIVPDLIRLLEQPVFDELQLDPGALHAVWTLDGLGAATAPDTGAAVFAALVNAFGHGAAPVREAAVAVLPRTEAARTALLKSGVHKDGNPHVRLAVALALSEMPEALEAGEALYAMLTDRSSPPDRWLADAILSGAAGQDVGFLRATLRQHTANDSDSSDSRVFDRVLRQVTTHHARRAPVDSIVSTLALLESASPSVAAPFLEGLVDGWPEDRPPQWNDEAKRQLTAVMDALEESVQDRLLALVRRWNQPELFGNRMTQVVSLLKQRLTDSELSENDRVVAAQRLLVLSDEPDNLTAVLEPVQLVTPPGLAVGLVQALTSRSRPEVAGVLMDHWPHLSPSARRTTVAALLRRPEWTDQLLEGLERGSLDRSDLNADHWAQLRQSRNRMIARRANRLWESRQISSDRETIVEERMPLAKRTGDAALGVRIYQENCLSCHRFNGDGGEIGPDLTGVGSRDRADILLDILDPNRSVESNYRLWHVTTRGGDTFSGRLDAETQTTVEILDTTGQKHVIDRKDIVELIASNASIMPTGFEALPDQDLVNLLEYLATTHDPSHP